MNQLVLSANVKIWLHWTHKPSSIDGLATLSVMLTNGLWAKVVEASVKSGLNVEQLAFVHDILAKIIQGVFDDDRVRLLFPFL